jgi:hypothetical protein
LPLTMLREAWRATSCRKSLLGRINLLARTELFDAL